MMWRPGGQWLDAASAGPEPRRRFLDESRIDIGLLRQRSDPLVKESLFMSRSI